MGIKHTTPITGPNNSQFQISADPWNQDHKIDSDVVPQTDGLFLGSDTNRFDGSKLINLPARLAILGCWHIIQAGAATFYYPFNHPFTTDNVVSEAVSALPAGTFIKIKVYVPVNALTGDTTFYLRHSGFGGRTLVLTVPAGQTGLFTANISYAVTEDSLNCLEVDTGGLAGNGINFNVSFVFQFA